MAKKAKQNEAQEYLLQVQKLDSSIDSRLEQVAHLKAMTTKITTTLKQDVVSGSGNQDKIGDAIAKIIDLENEINRDIDAYVDKKREICRVIESVKDPDQMVVLQKRYLLYEPWEQIALEMHCTYRNVCYIHGRALQTVAELMKGKEYGNKE
jgi:DNA-directed RNA polymerase specialized sigma24 family protein